jgi:cytoskeleton protein RodZ
MDLRELGALLRAERERRGLSIDQVSDKIKITRTCIAAIEDGNEDCLPHPVYAKGFIKNYAKLLEMDHEEFREQLAQIYQSEEAPLRDIPVLRDIEDASEGEAMPRLGGSGHRPALWLGGAVALIALIAVGWYLYTAFSAKSPRAQAPTAEPAGTAQPAPSAAKPAPAPKPPQAPTVAPAPVPSTPEPAPTPSSEPATLSKAAAPEPAKLPSEATSEGKPAVEPSAEDRATQDIALSGPQASAPAVTPAAPAAPGAKVFTVGDHGNHEVRIMANDRCWLQAGADGGTMRDTMLAQGDSFVGRFTDYLLVRLGNAGAVEIQFDGKVYPFHANKGSVKTLKFMGRNAEDAASPAATDKAPGTEKAPVAPKPGSQNAPVVPEKTGIPEQAAAADKTASAGETPAGGKELEVYGQDGSWVILLPDKGPAKELYVKKGQRLTVPFDQKIDVKLGNPSNVIFRYEGKETPVATERGEAKTLHFP